jgi:hypothetical protein
MVLDVRRQRGRGQLRDCGPFQPRIRGGAGETTDDTRSTAGRRACSLRATVMSDQLSGGRRRVDLGQAPRRYFGLDSLRQLRSDRPTVLDGSTLAAQGELPTSRPENAAIPGSGPLPRRSSHTLPAARRCSGAPRPADVHSSWDPSPRRLAGENPTSTPDPSRLIIHRQCNLRTHNLLKSFSTLAQQRWSAHGVLKGRGWRSGGTAGGHIPPPPQRDRSLWTVSI